MCDYVAGRKPLLVQCGRPVDYNEMQLSFFSLNYPLVCKACKNYLSAGVKVVEQFVWCILLSV